MNVDFKKYPKNDRFVSIKNSDYNEKVFTFAIGSNANNDDWNRFLDTNINKAIIDKSNNRKLSSSNIDNFRDCLKYIGEGVLSDHYLTFSSYSYKRQGLGVACIKKCIKCNLSGAVFELVTNESVHKNNIIDLLRWKEDFPGLYQEYLIPVRVNGDMVTCLLYNIDDRKDIGQSLNDTIPRIILPCSGYYFNVIYSSHVKNGFNSEWIDSLTKMKKSTDTCRGVLRNHFRMIYRAYNNHESMDFLRHIMKNYKNTNFKSYVNAKDNDYEYFRLCYLLSLTQIGHSLGYPYEEKHSIIDKCSKFELKSYIDILSVLQRWDSDMKAHQIAQ